MAAAPGRRGGRPRELALSFDLGSNVHDYTQFRVQEIASNRRRTLAPMMQRGE